MKLKSACYDIFSLGLISVCVFSVLLSGFSKVYSKSWIIEWEFFFLNSSFMEVSFIFDWVSLSFLSVVSLISGCVMKYSIYYMEGEKNYLRFIFVVMLFVGSMWLLVLSPNLISLLLGWDGLGLTSYILVIFYQNEKCCNAGMLTILSNRVGDVAILMGIGMLFIKGSWSVSLQEVSGSMWLGALIILAGMTKSAQLPFSAWLPAAMAAPTPVSALVHSSTLVTAGVYLLIRFFPMYSMNEVCMMGLLVISIGTMFMAGVSGNFEMDLKKVVALSTLSQLGLMMMSVSLGLRDLAYFHLVSHAMFKSALFMSVGCMIHNFGSTQDGRVMSGTVLSAPLLMMSMSITNLALIGTPFLSGFYSKDLLLEGSFMSGPSLIMMGMVVLSVGLTVSYSMRMMYMCSLCSASGPLIGVSSDFSKLLVRSMVVLLCGGVFGGFFFSWGFIYESGYSMLGWLEKYYILFIMLLFGSVSYNGMNGKSDKVVLKKINIMIGTMWHLPSISVKINKDFLNLGQELEGLYDKGWMELYGGRGGQKVGVMWSSVLQKGQSTVVVSGYLASYLMFVSCLFIFL
uniref:NADH-ubiquinone oxidoreductase chain 5 n=1 Tax=Haploginglymus sp. JP-2016 TaxID=1867951 RepID=A0A330IVD7_9CRUS|nr:ND5 [Haploginglymus sp. JP-2016]